MANLTNSAKLIEEMSKKAYKTELPTVNNATVTVAVNGNTGTNSFTTNQASNSTLKITVGKSDVGLGNVDNTSDANKPISTATQAALDLKADKSEISSVYKYKGSKANYDALPSSGNVTGDVWNVEAAHTTAPVFPAGSNLAWDGSAWDVLGGTVDLSNYVDKSTNQTIGGTKTFSTEPVLPSKSTAATNDGTKPATEAQVYSKADASDVNTKTFYLSNTSDLTNAQAAYNWYRAGKNPIIVLGGVEYIYYSVSSEAIKPIPYYFVGNGGLTRGNSSSQIILKKISLNVQSNNVESITSYTPESIRVLETNNDYTIAYTPSYDGSPATKKYVDDTASGKVSDTEYGVSWNGVTTIAPSKNAVYNKIETLQNTAGNGIDITNKIVSAKIGTGLEFGDDYSAMQGPAPDGFHVPSKDERVALCGAITSAFGISVSDIMIRTYLKMPKAGYRSNSDASVTSVESSGYYWSSTPRDATRAYRFNFSSSSTNPKNYNYRAGGFSVRCFKNNPEIPTSSWTTLYQGTGNAGVFRNPSLGLISVSGDGITWYTIQDKNLGATTVYNQGDTLTDANCGYFYQWGNNYGFAHSGTVTTSTTQVDASNYGPGNYYNSSTFITSGTSDRSSVQNDNLWGDTTGVITNAISNTGVLSVNGETGDVIVSGGHDYSWETKVISNGAVELGLRTIVDVSSNFTLNIPSDIQDGMEYVLRCVNYGAYTMTLGNGFINKFSSETTISLSANSTDQFTFIAKNGNLELQPETYYRAGLGISIGDYQDYSAIKGPCDEGFHIPSYTEWSNIKTIWTTLGGSGTDGNSFRDALKMPYGGARANGNGNTLNQGSSGYYHSNSPYSYQEKFYGFNIQQSKIDPYSYQCRAYALSIRPFKDTSVIPTSSWTKLYGTSIEAGGIFWNSNLGLISLSKNGTEWVTIADKNLGATQVWNSGDTLSEANCGKYYQWGNNYGFQRTGTLTNTSSTKVDASSYGHGNFYSSSTFITTSNNENWDSSNNTDLRGYNTGIVKDTNIITNSSINPVLLGEVIGNQAFTFDISKFGYLLIEFLYDGGSYYQTGSQLIPIKLLPITSMSKPYRYYPYSGSSSYTAYLEARGSSKTEYSFRTNTSNLIPFLIYGI